MGRTPCCEKNGLKKGPWTAEEDQKLIEYIQQHGQGRWRTVPKNAGLTRCGKSCRLRWTNYLRPDIKRGRFSFEEEETIIQLHSIWGNKWSAIAARLPGRTDNEIKNYWNTHIKKRLLRMGIDPVTHNPRLDLLDQLSSILSSSLCNPTTQLMTVQGLLGFQSMVNNIPCLPNPASALVSSQYKDLRSDFQQPLLENARIENQFQFFQGNDQPQSTVQEFQACTTSTATTSSTNFPSLFNDTKLMQANADHFSRDTANSSCLNDRLPSLYQNNEVSFSLAHSIAPQLHFGYANDMNCQSFAELLPQNQDFQFNNSNNAQNSGFGSVLPTPSSSPTPLNSSSTTHVLGSPENNEGDYCRNIIFQMADNLDVDGFM